jgi:serine/threonine-protein kinase
MIKPESLPPGSVPVAIGDVMVGKYRVDRILGVGGMGVVVAATHLQLDQKVALKFMLPAGLAHPELVERFSREARAAVRLRSDHVARVLDVGTLESGSPYIVMEYLAGEDLGSIVEQRGPLPVGVAVDCVLQASDAVAEAHALGIVHRDLKPRNLFLTQRNDGRALVKVLDFGISKHKTGAPDLSLTRTAEIIGSPNYMSPEQLKSAKAADERSDIWALGVILYELIAGQVPFVAESVTQLTAMVLTETPRPIDNLRPDVPRELSRIVQRCLEKDPQNRYPSVAQLAAALEPFAPSDTRELAQRIARIASGGNVVTGAPPTHGSSSARIVSGGVSVSWAERTELASRSNKRIAIFIGLGAVGALAIVVGVLFSRRPASDRPSAVSGGSAAAATTMTTATATAAAATAGAMNEVPPAGVGVAAPAASPAASSLPALEPQNGGPDAASSTPPAPSTSARPGTPTASGRPVARPAGPAPGSPSSDGPRYRTSW